MPLPRCFLGLQPQMALKSELLKLNHHGMIGFNGYTMVLSQQKKFLGPFQALSHLVPILSRGIEHVLRKWRNRAANARPDGSP